ncbi:MAG: T9SS type A sorting domain-containing protein, partial [Candidatus Krumholzibacteriota bacterium]|nr:T9SS type A sorting domain-containing protein [Candidatus Krumholzibacteriota bacterium]
PFNPATTIPYRVGQSLSGARVTIAFFDVSGKLIDRHELGIKPSGDHTFNWNPALSAGRNLPSGVYYCKLQIGKEAFTRKMIMLR